MNRTHMQETFTPREHVASKYRAFSWTESVSAQDLVPYMLGSYKHGPREIRPFPSLAYTRSLTGCLSGLVH